MKPRYWILIALFCAAAVVTTIALLDNNSLEKRLRQLDNELAQSDKYVATKYHRIKLLLDMRHNGYVSDEQAYQLNNKLYDEYFAFKLDSALYFLNENVALASRLANSRQRTAETMVELGLLYTTSGMYLEANDVLTQQLDTTALDREHLTRYYLVQQRFFRDFHEYTKLSLMTRTATAKLDFYSTKLFEMLDPASDDYLILRVKTALDQHLFEVADSVNHILLARHEPSSHEYAMHAYHQALIDYALNRSDFREWYAASAIADVMSATKDNASLCSLARQLFEDSDGERAFRYIMISTNDASFFNARLRPWQIAMIIPDIERSYTRRNRSMQLMQWAFSAALLAFAIFSYVMFRRAHRSSREIREKNSQISSINMELSSKNRQLSRMNTTITEANCVKEEYIGLLLSMCSNYIEKMVDMQHSFKRKLAAGKASELQKELSSTALMDAEVENFYNMFDGAFLRLYPNFVEEFNSMLKEDERITLPKGELLNTELRIFALIRLGITDSSKIAALLRYSVNTIYNYRAKVKNKSLVERDDFEDRIKTIGSFKS